MLALLIYLPFLLPVVVAQFSERHRLSPYDTGDLDLNRLLDLGLRYAPPLLLILINLGLLGVAALAMLNQLAVTIMPEQMDSQALAANWAGVAIACLLTAAAAFLPMIPAVRRGLAALLPIDPDSVVHTVALVLAVYQIGLGLGQMALIGDLENLAGAGFALSTWDVLLSGLPLFLFALAGVGLWVRRDGRGMLARLGLQRPTAGQLIVAAGFACALIFFDLAVTLVWQEVDPASYELVSGVSDNIFGDLLTVTGAVVLGLSAGISEELLFRGAVQPKLGLILATLLFTIGHLQYGFTLAMVEIFFLGLVLGLMRNWTNTTVCILIHAGYNAGGVMLAILQG